MAVTITIKDAPSAASLYFEDDDPHYWFLYPYFEATCREVGQMVDLYGDAEFIAEQLLAFLLILEDAEQDAQSRGDQWRVTVAYRGESREPIEKPLLKSDALARIGTLKQMLNLAYNTDHRVVCLRD